MSLFCRHNRFTADCPICSKGTVLEAGRKPARRKPSSAAAKRPAAERAAGRAFSGPHVAGPARRDADDTLFVIRLERVPGGVRLGEWRGATLAARAPVRVGLHVNLEERLPAPVEVAAYYLVAEALTNVAKYAEATQPRDATKLIAAIAAPVSPDADGHVGISRGRSGDFKEELRIEQLDDGRLRVARWVLRPGSGWELQDAPPMLPATRYAEALSDAARHGLISAQAASEAEVPAAAPREVDFADESRPQGRPQPSR